jgi:hypothetical protein
MTQPTYNRRNSYIYIYVGSWKLEHIRVEWNGTKASDKNLVGNWELARNESLRWNIEDKQNARETRESRGGIYDETSQNCLKAKTPFLAPLFWQRKPGQNRRRGCVIETIESIPHPASFKKSKRDPYNEYITYVDVCSWRGSTRLRDMISIEIIS